jgi:protein-tyrosine phosphatase
MVVLCAIEHQPPASAYPGIRVLHAPFDDASEPVDEATWETARQASREAAKQLLKGRRVLVTCHMGINRSGLVSALTLLRLTPMSGEDAVRTVQSRRPGALSNPYFVDAVLSAR